MSDYKLPEKKNRKVVIVGAGIAGLTAAYFLTKHGFDVQVLELNDSPGGRMRQIELEGLKVNSGARILYTFYSVVMELIDELGLQKELQFLEMSELICDDGSNRYPLSFSPDLSWLFNKNIDLGCRLKLAGILPALIKAKFVSNPDDMSTSAYLDGESLDSYIVRKVGKDFLDKIVNPLFRGARNWNACDVSPAFFLSTSAHMPGHRAFTFKQGIGFLAEQLASGLNVNYRVRVNSIQGNTEDAGVVIDYIENEKSCRLEADIVVCATEGAKLKELIKGKTTEEERFFEKIKYNSMGVVYYILKKADKHSVTFYTQKHPSSLALLEVVKNEKNKHHLFCELSPERAREIADKQNQTEMDTLILEDVRKRYPELDKQLDYSVNQWIEHMLPVFYPGYIASLKTFREQQAASAKSIYYCGDYLSQALVGGACFSGKDTAMQIIRHWADH